MAKKEIVDFKKKANEDIEKVKKTTKDLEKHNLKPEKFDNLKTKTDDRLRAKEYFDNLSESEKISFKHEVLKRKCRENYATYVKYVYEDFVMTRFHAYLLKLCEGIIKRIEQGRVLNVCLSVPPQRGKSKCFTETLPSWFIGRNPNKRVIITAYNADVAEKFGDKNRQLVKRFGKEIFDVEVSESQDNKTLWDIKNHDGGLLATGLNGSLTSNNGALIIVDDPFKSETDANNKAKRDEVWSNFVSSVWTRQRGLGNAIIVIHTRWHEDDLIGRIMASEDAEQWIVINLPEVWEGGIDNILHRKIGETLCPELGFTSEAAERTRKILGERLFNAMYQGKPYTDGGELVKRSFLKFYTKSTLPSIFDEITMSCDLSFGETHGNADPVGIGIFGRVGGTHYLLDWCFKKMSFTETLERLRYFCGKYPQMRNKIVEKKANGNSAIEVLNKEIGGFVGYDPKGNSKETRLQLCLPYIESGCLYLPDESVDRTFEEHTQELLKFPKATHDEIVDIITQYLLNYEYKYGGKINTDSSYITISQAFRGIKI